MKILFAVNSVWNLINFCADLIRALVQAGYEVVAVAPPDEYVSRLVALGCRYIEMPMDNRGTHSVRDALLRMRLIWVLRTERLGGMLGYTVKPNICGSIACHVLGIPTIHNISGLGGCLSRVAGSLRSCSFSIVRPSQVRRTCFSKIRTTRPCSFPEAWLRGGARACCRALGSIWCGLRQSWPSGIHNRVPATNSLPELSGFC